MRTNLIYATALLSLLFLTSFSEGNDPSEKTSLQLKWQQHTFSSYSCLSDSTLSYEAFDYALRGYYSLLEQDKLDNRKYLTIVDFTQHSSQKRMYVIDMDDFSIELKTYCAHGKNTGGAQANHFSNKNGSLQSSLGFYIANETYRGKFDYAMRLDGVEYSNYRARERGIVMHGASYATPSFLKRNNNVLGRSYGCPAVPKNEAKTIIDLIKGGSCLFIYAGKADYAAQSKLINSDLFLRSARMLFDA